METNRNTKKVELEVWSGPEKKGTEPFLVTDKFGRLRMSSALVQMLKCEGIPYVAYLAYDKSNGRIALGPVDVVKPTDASPVKFDAKRHYGFVLGFIKRHQIPTNRVRYYYDGKWNGWLMFRREDIEPADPRA